MPDKKLTDLEIVKALECCISNIPCYKTKCPFKTKELCGDDIKALEKQALDLINRLQEENERLKTQLYLEKYTDVAKRTIKAEAYKEFCGRLKTKASDFEFGKAVWVVYINNLLKEMVGDNETVL